MFLPDGRWPTAGVLPFVLALSLWGCDLPTGAPSIQTNAGIRSPLIAQQTFSFLGGPQSKHDPLIDTTRVAFDSLLSVRGGDNRIFVEQEVETFGLEPIDQPLDAVSRDLRIDTSLSTSPLKEGPWSRQGVQASYKRTNGTFESPGRTVFSPLPTTSGGTDTSLPFPIRDVVDSPTTDLVDASTATVEAVTLTAEPVNTITLTLENRQPQGTPLTGGASGTAPELSIRHVDGTVLLPFTPLGSGPIGPGQRRSMDVDLSGVTLSHGASIHLRISGHDGHDRLGIETDPHLRYESVTLSDIDDIQVEARATGLHAPTETPLRVAGVEVARGQLDVQISNQLSFPLRVTEVTFSNTPDARRSLPESFPPLRVSSRDRPAKEVAVDGSITESFDLSGSGVAQRVDAVLRGTPARTGGTVTLHASGAIQTDGRGDVRLSKTYFWPDGEKIHTSGVLPVDARTVDFERAGDYVDLSSVRLHVDPMKSDLDVSFRSFSISYPDVRHRDKNGDGQRYGPGDSLLVSFVENPSGPYQFPPLTADDGERSLEISAGPVRLFPEGNGLAYHVQGTLTQVPDTTREYLHVVRTDDEVRADVAFDQFDIRALRARVSPFDFFVTPDADGNGRLDVTDHAETVGTSFHEMQALLDRMSGVDLREGKLTLSVESNVEGDLRFYGAIRGDTPDGAPYLAGRGTYRVSEADPAAKDFEAAGASVEPKKLIQFEVSPSSAGGAAANTVQLTRANSTLNDVLARMPTRLTMAGKSRVLGGRVHVRSPVKLDLGVGFSMPLSFNGAFSYRDTLSADLTGLEALTDPTKKVSLSSATLHFRYSNSMPIGFDATMTVVDEQGNNAVPIPAEGAQIDLDAAPKDDDGTAASPRKGVATVDLSEQDVYRLAHGSTLRLQLTMRQQTDGPPAQVRADDTIRLALDADISATVQAEY